VCARALAAFVAFAVTFTVIVAFTLEWSEIVQFLIDSAKVWLIVTVIAIAA